MKIYGAITALIVLATATAKPADAQLSWTVIGVGEFDTEDVALVLGGISVSPAGQGWKPVAGLHASWLQYPIGSNDTREVITVHPTVGVRRGFDGGSFQFRVGYAFRDANDDDDEIVSGIPPVAADIGDDGITNSTQLEYWGDGSWEAQLIGSYNYGSESLWSRARLMRRLFGMGDRGQIKAGGEAAYLTGEDYNAWQVGGVAGLHFGGGTIINLGIGQKLAGGNAPDATYFRAELVLTPGR
jgi:hypothetical protein